MSDVSPSSLPDGTRRKPQTYLGNLSSSKASPSRKRKQSSEDSGFDESGAKLEDRFPSARTRPLRTDVADQSHPPSSSTSIPHSQKWEQLQQGLETPSARSAGSRPFSTSLVTETLEELAQDLGTGLPPPPNPKRSPCPATTPQPQPQPVRQEFMPISPELKCLINDDHLKTSWNGNELCEIEITDEQLSHENYTVHLQDLDLSWKDPDGDIERAVTPEGAREIEKAWKGGLMRYKVNSTWSEMRKEEAVFEHCCVIDEAFVEQLMQGQQRALARLNSDAQVNLSYLVDFWTLPRLVLQIPDSRFVLDEDEACDGRPSKLFAMASESVKRKEREVLSAFENVGYYGKEISFEGRDSLNDWVL